MKGPTRLIHEDSDFARLVAASANEEPANDQLAKALAMANDAGAETHWSLAWRGSLAARVAIGVAVLGLVATGIATMRGGDGAEKPSARVVELGAAAVASPPAEVARAVDAVPEPVSVNDLADAPPAIATAPRRTAARSSAEAGSRAVPFGGASTPEKPPERSGHGTFAEELALVSAARAALEKGDLAACQLAVDRYEARFRAGTFAEEIEVLRIETLAASGDSARAKTLADRFLGAHATSPYAGRVRSLTERIPN